jgi:VanZ family protein
LTGNAVDLNGPKMSLSKSIVIAFRLAFIATVVVIMYLATTKVEYEVVEEINDKVSHILAFVALSFLLDFSFPKRSFDVRKVMVLLGLGLMIECVQYFIPYRTCSLFDLGADGIGIALYGVSKLIWRYRPFYGRSRDAADGKMVATVGAETASPKRGPIDVR